MSRAIVLLVMAEEKWQEADFLDKEREKRGYRVLMLDMGLTGKPQGRCDITREEVIQASSRSSEEVTLIADRGKRMPMMVEGVIQKVRQLYSEGKIDGIISIGGTTGTQMGTAIMRSLPFGVPKLAVSSTASLPGFASRNIGTADIALMHSVVEIAGLNNLMKNVLTRAAGAIYGMVEGSTKVPISQPGKDENFFGFTRAAGPTRLEAAGKRGIPQLVAPCGVNWGSPLKRKYTPAYEQRKKVDYDAVRTFIRLSKEEMILVANTIAGKLNKALGPVKVIIPLGGWSSLDKRGTDFYERDLNKPLGEE